MPAQRRSTSPPGLQLPLNFDPPAADSTPRPPVLTVVRDDTPPPAPALTTADVDALNYADAQAGYEAARRYYDLLGRGQGPRRLQTAQERVRRAQERRLRTVQDYADAAAHEPARAAFARTAWRLSNQDAARAESALRVVQGELAGTAVSREDSARAAHAELSWLCLAHDRRAAVEQRLLETQPSYLAPVPEADADRNRWVEQALVVETYRQRHGVTDPEHPLGPRPTAFLVAEWTQTHTRLGIPLPGEDPRTLESLLERNLPRRTHSRDTGHDMGLSID